MGRTPLVSVSRCSRPRMASRGRQRAHRSAPPFRRMPHNTGFATAPGATVTVNGQLTAAIPSGASFYLAWNYAVCTGSTTDQRAGACDRQRLHHRHCRSAADQSERHVAGEQYDSVTRRFGHADSQRHAWQQSSEHGHRGVSRSVAARTRQRGVHGHRRRTPSRSPGRSQRTSRRRPKTSPLRSRTRKGATATRPPLS